MRWLCLALVLAGCGEKRKPIGRGDGGPSVVVTDGRAPDLGLMPATPEHEPNDTVAQAQPLTTRIEGMIDAKDVDVYRVDPATIDVDGGVPVGDVALRSAGGALELQLVDDKGKTILTREATTSLVAKISALGLPAWVRVRGKTSATYTLECAARTGTAGEEVEPNDDVKRANPLPEGGTATGTLDPGDRDVLTLPDAPDDSTWRVELTAIPDVAPKIELRRGEQVIVTTRAGKGGELRLRNLPAGAGLTLMLRSVEGPGGPYTLRVTGEPAIDATLEREPDDDPAHATHVVPGDVAGYLWPGDVDFFCADVSIGARVDAMPDVDFKLELTDAHGTTIAKADEGKRGSAEALPVDPRARCVKLSAHGHDTAFDSPYKLSIVAQ